MAGTERMRRAAVCRDSLESLLGGEPAAAIPQLSGLIKAKPGAPYRIEAAFLLALAVAVPGARAPLDAGTAALRTAAEGGHPIYSPAAAFLLAAHATRTGEHDLATPLWHDLAEPYRLGYSPAALFHLALDRDRAGDPDRAREFMAEARATGDPWYAPKALSWLITYYLRQGRHDRIEALAEIAFDFPDDPLLSDRIAAIREHLVIARRRLVRLSDPAEVLAGAHTLARANGVDHEPLPVALADDLQFQPTPMPGADLPWFDPYVRNQPGTDRLATAALQALAYADYACTQAAIQYLEQNNGPANAFANIVHYANRFPWGPVMHESIRQRMLAVLQIPEHFIPADWACAPEP